jgi:uncharacterized protein
LRYTVRVLIVVSPAKSLDYTSPLATRKYTEPLLLDRSEELVAIMSRKTPAQIEALMSISPALATLNHERFQDWERPFTRKNSRAALLAFDGDVYDGMDARHSFTERDFTHAQKTLRILSGLYGVLRPLDLMMPYRLEMGTRLANPHGRDLYSYWGDTITENLREDIAASPGSKVLINLASAEYFGSVRPAKLGAPVIAPAFLDANRAGDHKIVSFFAKKARGAMTAWIIRERISSPSHLSAFEGLGYRFDPTQSTAARPVFVRDPAMD